MTSRRGHDDKPLSSRQRSRSRSRSPHRGHGGVGGGGYSSRRDRSRSHDRSRDRRGGGHRGSSRDRRYRDPSPPRGHRDRRTSDDYKRPQGDRRDQDDAREKDRETKSHSSKHPDSKISHGVKSNAETDEIEDKETIFVEEQEIDEEKLIEERRKRRQEILKKYQDGGAVAASSQGNPPASLPAVTDPKSHAATTAVAGSLNGKTVSLPSATIPPTLSQQHQRAAVGGSPEKPTDAESASAAGSMCPSTTKGFDSVSGVKGSDSIPVNRFLQTLKKDAQGRIGSMSPHAKGPVSLDFSLEKENGDESYSFAAGSYAGEGEGAGAMISAADYDPNADRDADVERERERRLLKLANREMDTLAGEYGEAGQRELLKRQFPAQGPSSAAPRASVWQGDMFADVDDMFAETPVDSKALVKDIFVAPTKPAQQENLTLTDNWDDEEGYYKLQIGEMVDGRYLVTGHLGKGVFSTVVKAIDKMNWDVEVAIKIMRNNETMYRAGLKELGIIKKLMSNDPENKKHVIQFIRNFEFRNHLCLVFELLSLNLREVLKMFGKDVGLNIKAVRIYGQQLFLALLLLNRCDILHADIKPDNILVNENKNNLRLCDFGSAFDAKETDLTPYLVSRFYRAPEIILGHPYDAGIDIWSVGCTLYELYTGKILFPGRDNNHMLLLIMELRGKFPHRVIRKSSFRAKHFDEDLSFLFRDFDRASNHEVIRRMQNVNVTRDLKSRIMPPGKKMSEDEKKILGNFVDLLEKCLTTNPEKRIKAREALKHPFFS